MFIMHTFYVINALYRFIQLKCNQYSENIKSVLITAHYIYFNCIHSITKCSGTVCLVFHVTQQKIGLSLAQT